MHHRCTALALLLLLSVLSWPASADAVDVSASSIQLGEWSRVIKDEEGSLTVDTLLNDTATYSGVAGSTINSFGFTDAVYWFVVPLHNPQATPLQRLLVFEPIWLDDIQVTLVDADGSRKRFHGGDFLPYSERSRDHRKINFALTLKPGTSQLLVRIKTVDPFVVNMALMKESTFYHADSIESSYLGVVYGTLVAMLLYNLVIFFSIRESVYAAYALYVLSFMGWHLISNGLTFHYLWPDSPQWANWSESIAIYILMLSGLFFTIHFLQLRQRMPQVFRWAAAALSAIFISFVATSLGGYQLHVSSSVWWVFAYTPLVLILGILSLIDGNRAARFFLPATAAGFIGSLITAMAVSGFIPFSTLSYRAVDIGMMIDAILLSIALADRLKIARLEAEQARTELFRATQQHAEKLELQVAQRTHELSEANATKDRFFSIIAHDLRGPISSLALLYNDIVKSPADLTHEILNLSRNGINQTHHLLEELLTWARSQRGEMEFSPQDVDIAQCLVEVQQLHETQANAKGIELRLELDGPYWVYADRAMIQTILRNLVANALKYSNNGGEICAAICPQQDYYQIRISDNGTGIDAETQKKLFQLDERPRPAPGTEQEQGAGLGLILCRDFVERCGGTIGVESVPGSGASFWFTLPSASTE